MSTVAYLRWQEEHQVQVCFVTSKTKVAPLKPMSIPRLELQAACMGAKLGHYLKQNLELKISRCTYWTDSKTVLHWIRSEARRFKVFVAQRVGEIQERTEVDQWKYVPSKENVADEATKAYSKYNFSENNRWISGPQFLSLSHDLWPQESVENKADFKDKEEREYVFLNFSVQTQNLCIPDVSRFSRWNRLLRTTAWLLRYKFNCKTKRMKSGELDVEEITEAENLLLRQMQIESFPEEIKKLSNKLRIDTRSRIFSLDCVYENNLVKLGGRLNNAASLTENSRKPVILDPNHRITKLIIQNEHENVFHHGQEIVVNNLREKFWIISIRKAVRSCWAQCQKCKNRNATPHVPVMGQLPEFRLEPTIRPFIKTGVDYFGPIEVTVKRSHEKRYGVIFTCMVTRAVHIEIAHDLSTDSFIHVLRQFACRRGYPEQIISDNGSNFRGADTELKKNINALNQTDIVKFCTLKKIKWTFNPPSAPHMGGIWERMIRSIKTHLHEVLTSRYPQEYVLRTVLIEIEHILNCRPLTHISTDPKDHESLTPNHFLIGPSYTVLPCANIDERNINLVSKWKYAQKLTDIFWKRWSREYLLSLIKRSKWHLEHRNIEVGDVVLISDPMSPRNTWPIATVTQVYPAKDGRVRMVDVTLSNKMVLRRPVSRLCVLDVRQNSTDRRM